MSRRSAVRGKHTLTQEFYPVYTGNEPCAGYEDLYLHENPRYLKAEEVDTMRQQCASCPLLDQCRTWAIAHETFGFWGGMTQFERDDHRKEHAIMHQEPSRSFLNGDHDKRPPSQCSKGHWVALRDVRYNENRRRWEFSCDECRAEFQEVCRSKAIKGQAARNGHVRASKPVMAQRS